MRKLYIRKAEDKACTKKAMVLCNGLRTGSVSYINNLLTQIPNHPGNALTYLEEKPT